mgnify:CR=1 FL=1
MANTRETREVMLQEARPKRVPLHEQRRNRLTFTNQDPNYVYRVVNDVDNRIEQFKLAGYEVVEHNTKVGDTAVVDGNVSLGSGARVHVGSGRNAILMRVPRKLYEEDQTAKQREITRKENLLIRRKRKSSEAGEDGTYGEVSIERNS